MSDAPIKLKSWFDSLSTADQREVYKYLYGDVFPVTESYNLGPNPLIKSLNLGATPMNVSTPTVCPTCGKRL